MFEAPVFWFSIMLGGTLWFGIAGWKQGRSDLGGRVLNAALIVLILFAIGGLTWFLWLLATLIADLHL